VLRWPIRRLVRAYRLCCAREDARLLGLRTPEGVWTCAPCRLAFFDRFDYLVHAAGC
jgi:hypothetical protein